MIAPVDTKLCSRCGASKPPTEFYVSRHNANGTITLRGECKTCHPLKVRRGKSTPWTRKHRSRVKDRIAAGHLRIAECPCGNLYKTARATGGDGCPECAEVLRHIHRVIDAAIIVDRRRRDHDPMCINRGDIVSEVYAAYRAFWKRRGMRQPEVSSSHIQTYWAEKQ